MVDRQSPITVFRSNTAHTHPSVFCCHRPGSDLCRYGCCPLVWSGRGRRQSESPAMARSHTTSSMVVTRISALALVTARMCSPRVDCFAAHVPTHALDDVPAG